MIDLRNLDFTWKPAVFNIKKHGVLNEEKIREEAKSVGEGGVDEGGRERIER